jgi:outer membrane lipoprotein-sorting protein
MLVVFLLLAGFGLLSAQDAASVVKASRNRIQAESTSTKFRMTITPRRGNPSTREMLQFSKDGPNGYRIALAFQRPAQYADTRFLTTENAGNPDDRWIFLNNRIRRLSGGEGAAAFVGTDFSYDDLAAQDRNVDLDTHSVLREEDLNGKACYVIDSVPKNASYQYGKMTQWIGKADSVVYKIEMYDQKGAQVKLYEILELKVVDGRLSPWKTKMTSVKTGSSTTLDVMELEYNTMIPDKLFSQQWLETGQY